MLTSGRELARAVRRLAEVQDLAQDLPRTDRLPRSRVLSLARFAGASKAQAIARLPGERRIATLLAFVRTLEASAQDDVLDLFDVVVTKILTDAEKREEGTPGCAACATSTKPPSCCAMSAFPSCPSQAGSRRRPRPGNTVAQTATSTRAWPSHKRI